MKKGLGGTSPSAVWVEIRWIAGMIQAEMLTSENVDRLASLYAKFSGCAKEKYRWDLDPVDFDTFKLAIQQQEISGYLVEDGPEPVGFMLYRVEDHRAIEINVIYMKKGTEPKTFLDRLMRKFVADVRDEEGWDVVSYAMLGEQEKLIRTMTWYGFKPMGQAILNFNLTDPVAVQILMNQAQPPLPEGYRLEAWQPQYAGGVAETLFEAFSKAADAKWDPRFRSLLGTRKIVAQLTAGYMGTLQKECTTVLLKGDVPVGVCFMLEPRPGIGNIPLVGVRPEEKGQGFGNQLLRNTLLIAIQAILDAKLGLFSINATMETDNFAAIKMYRRMGFVEEYNYPHVYLEHSDMKEMKVGQWC